MGERAVSSNVEERAIETRVHGRYLVDRGASRESAPLLVGCHGYAENADLHLDKLRRIPGAEEWLLCAVQGLHRFYNPKTGDVIASWMTSQGRERAIDDNVRYLAGVVAETRRRHGTSDRLVLAGFSQGVAMAYRAAARSGFECHGLILLAGDVPPDVATSAAAGLPPVLLGRGTEDAWYTEEKMAQDLDTLGRLGVEVETCVFDGGHDWTPEFYHAAGEFLARRVSE